MKAKLTAQLSVVIAICVSFKLFYSTANVNELIWVLAPTKVLVEIVTGTSFTFESYSGYMSSDHSFLIAASCSGVNFLITAFLMLSLGHLWKFRGQDAQWSFVPLFLSVAYATTIIANTVRISMALFIRRTDPELIWLNPGDLHRFEGVAVYFGFLLLLYVISDKLYVSPGPVRPGVRGVLGRAVLPLGVYYATTIGVPLANGALRHGPAAAQFWQHSLFVLMIPLFLLALLATLSFLKGQQAAHDQKTLNDPSAAGT